MGPLSITSSYVALVATISEAVYLISTFARDVRGALGELDAIGRELRSLQLVTESITGDTIGPIALLARLEALYTI
jgi:hypothetical protein